MSNACLDGYRNSALSCVTATLALLAGLSGLPEPALGRALAVGPDRVLKLPSQAATIAADGDVIRIDPGEYADCAVWRASWLTIEGTGPDVIMRGKTCQDKAIFITAGNNIMIRGITFAAARVIYHNGAGIRAEGANLTVEDSHFLDNENGILAGGPPHSAVRITGSTFRGNGSCEGACAHAVYAGAAIALLDVEGCTFADTRIAHHIKSRARATVVSGNRIEDGPTGTSSYLIELPNGGNALIQNNVLHKGRRSDNPSAAISIGAEGATNPSDTLIVQGNQFTSDLPGPTIFVRNSTSVAATLIANRLSGRVTPLYGRGTVEPGLATLNNEAQ